MNRLFPVLLFFIFFAETNIQAQETRPLKFVAAVRNLDTIRTYCPERFKYYHQIFHRCENQPIEEQNVLAPAEFKKYSAVIVSGYLKLGKRGLATAEEFNEIKDYVKNGGTLAITWDSYMRNGLSANFAQDKDLKIVTRTFKSPQSCKIETHDHQLARNLANDLELKSTVAVLKNKDMISIAGDPEVSIYSVIPFGKGKFILLPDSVIPNCNISEMKPADAKKTIENTKVLSANLLAFINPPLIDTVIKGGTKSAKDLITFWYREIPYLVFEGPEQLAPPYMKDGETINSISMNTGATEWERKIFYTTFKAPVKNLKVSVTDFIDGDKKLNLDHSSVLALMAPNDTYEGPNVFMRNVSDQGQGTVEIRRSSSVLWVFRIHAEKALPGNYSGKITFNADGADFSLPVKIKVWPLALDRRYLDYDVEYFFRDHYDFNNPAYGKSLLNFDLILKDFRIHWVNWALGGVPGYGEIGGKLKDGRDFNGVLKINPGEFKNNLPPFDFSGMDGFINKLIENDITVYRSYGLQTNVLKAVTLAEQIYMVKGLTSYSPETRALLLHWMTESRRYYRDKGFPRVYTKFSDEWGEKYLPVFCEEAKIAQEAGWRVIANPNQNEILEKTEFRNKVWDMTNLWWYAFDAAFMRTCDIMRKEQPNVKPELWTTITSSFWWNIFPRHGLRAGWELAYHDFNGIHFHGWRRDYPYAGVYLDKTEYPFNIYPSMGYEFLGEGIEEGQYLMMAKEILKTITAKKDNLDLVRKAQVELDMIIGKDPKSTLLLKPVKSDYNIPVNMDQIGFQNDIKFEDYHTAKVKLFNLIGELLKTVPDPGIDVMWDDMFFVKDGKIVSELIVGDCGQESIVIKDFIRQKAGVDINIFKSDKNTKTSNLKLLVGIRGEKWLEDVIKLYPDIGITATYPAKGSYLIYPSSDKKTMIIYGSDIEGIKWGCRALANFMDTKNGWLFVNKTVAGNKK